MKKSELFFSFLLIPLDYLMIILAGISAYYIALLIIALLWIPIFAFTGLYNIRTARKIIKEMYGVVSACSTGLMLVVVLIFMRRELFDSRFIVLTAWLLAILYIVIGRVLVRWLQRYLFKFGIGVRNVVLIGNSKTGDYLITKFSTDKSFGFKVVKRIRDIEAKTMKELDDFIKVNRNNRQNRVDEIIQSDPNLTKTEMLKLYDFADEHHLSFRYVVDLLGTKVLKTEIMEIFGIPVVETQKTSLEGWGRIVKRLFDIVVSGILIILFSPILLLFAILIKIESRGPVFFSHKDDGSKLKRVGQNGELFNYFKFRSMVAGSDSMRYNELANQNARSEGPLVKIKNDPRVTKIGKIIRRWSIDELPELFLVFTGKISLVGPRPHLPEEVAKYEQRHKKVLTVKPGMTGLAQISGRSDLNFEEEVKLDTYYVENWSFLFDIAILLRTPMALINHKEAE